MTVSSRGTLASWGASVWIGLAIMLIASVSQGATEMAVTIDDLPTHGPLPNGLRRLDVAAQLIDGLNRHAVTGVHGFLNGGQLRGDPEHEPVVRAWQDAGLLLGNHTFSHADLTGTTAVDYIADIERNDAVIMRRARFGVGRYFRYPYLHEGDSHDKRTAVRRWLASRGYTVAQVTVYFEDWAWNDAYARCVAQGDTATLARMKTMFLQTAMASLDWSRETSRRLFKRDIKHILLLHIGAFDALMIDDMLRAYRAAGVTFVSLDVAAGDPVYAIDPGVVWDGERTFLHQVAESRGVQIPVKSSMQQAVAELCR